MTTIATVTSTNLLQRAQAGDEDASNLLMRLIRDHYTPGVIKQYRTRNVLVSEDDIASEFLLGCWMATSKAKLDIGNPMKFIIWKGRMAVASLFRKKIQGGVKFTCFECGTQGNIRNHNGAPACTACYSRDLWTTMYEVEDISEKPDGYDNKSGGMMLRPSLSAEHIWQLATYGVQIEEMRARLTGRALQLFDILVVEGVNRESSQNYLAEIAGRWGVSTTAVAAHLRTLRAKILEYVEQG